MGHKLELTRMWFICSPWTSSVTEKLHVLITAIMHICGSAWARLRPLFQSEGRAIMKEATLSGVICGKFNRFGWLSSGKLDFISSLLEPFGKLCEWEYRIRHVVAGLISKYLRLFQFRFWQESYTNCGYQWKYKQEKTWEGTLSSKF